MTATVTAKIKAAKKANPELVVFREYDNSNGWSLVNNQQWFSHSEYFACLPQHSEECLHWLNGGKVEYKGYASGGCAVILDVPRKWSPTSVFMESECEITKVIVKDEATKSSVDNPAQTFESEKHNMPEGATHYRELYPLLHWLKLDEDEAYKYRKGHGWELFTPTLPDVIIHLDGVTPIPQDGYKNGEWLKYLNNPALCRYVCFDAALNLHLIDTDDSLIHVSGDDISRPETSNEERYKAAKHLYEGMRGKLVADEDAEFEDLSFDETSNWLMLVDITGFKL